MGVEGVGGLKENVSFGESITTPTLAILFGFVWSDFGMTAPANVIARVTDEVKVEILLAVRPLCDSEG